LRGGGKEREYHWKANNESYFKCGRKRRYEEKGNPKQIRGKKERGGTRSRHKLPRSKEITGEKNRFKLKEKGGEAFRQQA